MAHQLYDIWWDFSTSTWKVQLMDYVGTFPTKEQAEGYVASVKEHRKKWGTK